MLCTPRASNGPDRLGLRALQNYLRAILAACCTVPVVMLLEKLFTMLRTPADRAVVGDFVTPEEAAKTPAQLAMELALREKAKAGKKGCCGRGRKEDEDDGVTDISKNLDDDTGFEEEEEGKGCCGRRKNGADDETDEEAGDAGKDEEEGMSCIQKLKASRGSTAATTVDAPRCSCKLS